MKPNNTILLWPFIGLVLTGPVGQSHAAGKVIAWPYNEAPSGLTNVVAIAGGFEHSLALTVEGRVAAWGNFGNDVPSGLWDVMAVAAGADNLALKADGRVVAWNQNGTIDTNVPPELLNVVAI